MWFMCSVDDHMWRFVLTSCVLRILVAFAELRAGINTGIQGMRRLYRNSGASSCWSGGWLGHVEWGLKSLVLVSSSPGVVQCWSN